MKATLKAAAVAAGLATMSVPAYADTLDTGTWSNYFGSLGIQNVGGNNIGNVDTSVSVLPGLLAVAVHLEADFDYSLTFDAGATGGLSGLVVGLVSSLSGNYFSILSGATVLGSTLPNGGVSVGIGTATSNTLSFSSATDFVGYLVFAGSVSASLVQSFSSFGGGHDEGHGHGHGHGHDHGPTFVQNSLWIDNVGLTGTPKDFSAPGPIAGAGLPMLLAAGAGAFAWRRRAV